MGILDELLHLSREIGREDRNLALLGEGNTSARLSDDRYLVKASGASLGNLREQDVVECRLPAILPLLSRDSMTDAEIEEALLAARVNGQAAKPSVETMFHAWGLSLPGVNFVGHCHPVHVNQILCSPRAREFAEKRMFADEIVMCGAASVFVPMTDPGLKLAQAIKQESDAFVARFNCVPRLVLLQNHGMIALGATAQSVLGALLMAEKAAQVFVGAARLGGPVFLSAKQIERIATRPDELYRQRLLEEMVGPTVARA